MRFGLLLACGGALLVAAPALASPACNPFSDQEHEALLALIDLGVKSGGLPVAGNADFLAMKLKSLPACDAPVASAPVSPPAKPEPPAK